MKTLPHEQSRGWSVTFVLGGLFLLNLLLVLPGWVAARRPVAPWIALEALVVVGVLLLLPRFRTPLRFQNQNLGRAGWRRAWRGGIGSLVALGALVVAVLSVADVAARESLARPLNLYLDVRLVQPVASLLAGNLGPVRATLLAVGALLATLGVGLLLAWLLAGVLRGSEAGPEARTSRALGPRLTRAPLTRAGAGLAMLVLPLGLWGEARWVQAPDEASAAGAALDRLRTWTGIPVVDLFREQRVILARMLGERETFASEMAAVPASYAGLPGLLEGLGGQEVILAFVESYGISAVEDPRYAPVVGPRLDDMERRLAAAGLHIVSGRLQAPSQGGQSWFGRGTVQSGLWLDNQLRYDLLLASPRETLVDDFRRAGYATAAVMPAITLAWPEGERFGYDRIFAHRDMEYAGPPINWVTKPDEYTWCFFQERVRRTGPAERPLFTEVALISSHAPWVPILPVLGDCEAVGDGRIFQQWMEGSERPEELWRDVERIREHFAMAVEYALHATLVFAERDLGPDALLIVMGDHQPAPLVTGEEASISVPVHVISGRPELLAPFLAWGFVPGAHPPPEDSGAGGDLRMDRFRHWFVPTFSPDPDRAP